MLTKGGTVGTYCTTIVETMITHVSCQMHFLYENQAFCEIIMKKFGRGKQTLGD